MPDAEPKSRFLAFAETFDFFFFDQYGVLHNGRRPYPGALETLSRLKARGAKIAVLSNSGRSGEENAERMERFGFFAAAHYDVFVTSGDAARELIASDHPPIDLASIRTCFVIETEGAADFAAALGLQRSQDPGSADLIALCGSQADRLGLEAYETMLAPAAARKTPCLCINPDKWMLTPSGRAPGAGALAERYQALGGEVVWIGKPYLPIYQYAQRKLGVADPAQVLCVGDSVEHDIVGARTFGAAAALMLTGILAELSEGELQREFARHGVRADLVVADFTQQSTHAP